MDRAIKKMISDIDVFVESVDMSKHGDYLDEIVSELCAIARRLERERYEEFNKEVMEA